MEMAVSVSRSSVLSLTEFSRFSSSSPSSNDISLRCSSVKKTIERKRMVSMPAKAKFGLQKGGTGLLERPTFDQSQFDPTPQAEAGGDMGRLKDKRGAGTGDSYRVLLVDDTRHTEDLVAKVLPRVIPSVSSDDGRRLFHESRENGVAVVVVTVKEHAEFYAYMMIRGGLRSAVEPDSVVG